MLTRISLLLLLFVAIVPSVGFYTIISFLLLTLISLYFVTNLFKRSLWEEKIEANVKINAKTIFVFYFLLLAYAAMYYGGLYQSKDTLIFGYVLLFLYIVCFIFYSFVEKLSHKSFLTLTLCCYLIISIWTIVNSPRPPCDCFGQINDATYALLDGKNPYATTFTQVYQGVTADYFDYLPFSFIYALPFVLVFQDPRYGVVVANIVIVLLILKIYKGKSTQTIVYTSAATFLFFPRSFYMIEHMYQDTIVFMFFILYLYFLKMRKNGKSYFALGLFFTIKQHLFILLPLLFKNIQTFKKFVFSPKIIFFLIPFILPLIFLLWNPSEFIKDTFLFFNPHSQPAPISASLSFPTFFISILGNQSRTIVYVLSALAFLVLYFFHIRQKSSSIYKITSTIFLFEYFMYNSFYNHYYFFACFLLLLIMQTVYDKKQSSNDQL